MTAFRHAARVSLIPLVITVATSCDDDPTGNDGAIEISVSPATASVPQGGASFINVTITRTGGFDGTVTLTAANLPNGVSATMDPASLQPGTTSARIDFVATNAAVPANSIVTIAASSPGVQSVSTTVNLTVTAWSITVAPAAITIAAGSSGTVAVNIDRQGFTGSVGLQLIGAPTGVAASFDPAVPTGALSTLTLTVGGNVTPGNYALRVAEPGPMPDRIANLQLMVVAAPGGAGNVEYLYCDPNQAPSFFAFQDGAGAWQPVAPTVSGGATRFAFTLSSGRGGILEVYQSTPAFAVHSSAFRARSRYASRAAPSWSVARRANTSTGAAAGDVYSTTVLYGTTAELAEDGAASCAATLPTKTAHATVSGLVAGQYAVVSLGGSTVYLNAGEGEFEANFEGVQTGLVDFIGARIATPGQPPDRLLLYRNLEPVDGATLPVSINFNSASAFAPATAIATITGGNNDNLEVYNEVVTSTSSMLLWSDLAPSPTASRPWAGLNAANLLPTDFHGLIVFASDVSSPGDFRVTSKYVGTVSNQTISLGGSVNAAVINELAAGNYPRYRFNGLLPAEYNKGIGISVFAEGGNDFLIMVARGYLAAAGDPQSYDLVMPDALSITGFPWDARLTAGSNFVTTDAFGFTGAGTFGSRPAPGNEFRASVRVRSIVVP